MLRSMTGFGRAVVEDSGRLITVEIRSVNHRFLDVAFRTPRDLQPLEGRLKELIQRKIERGRVSVAVSWDGSPDTPTSVSLDEELAEGYFTALRRLKELHQLPGTVDLGTLAGLPDLFRFDRVEWELEDVWPLVEQSVSQALDDLLRMKTEEGERLARDLAERAENVRARADRIVERLPVRTREGAEALRERVRKLLGDQELPEDRLAAEVALLADRLDCTEECVRLSIHLDQFVKYVSEEGAPGRRLNFLLQEMGREANTMAAKANDALVSQEVVVVKEELERMREQVQNVE